MSKKRKIELVRVDPDPLSVLAMASQEPAIRAMRKAYRASKQFQLDNLLARELTQKIVEGK